MKKICIGDDEYNPVEFVLLVVAAVALVVAAVIFATDDSCTLIDGCFGNTPIAIAMLAAVVCFVSAFCVRVSCTEDER